MSSSKSHQLREKGLEIDVNFLADQDIWYFLGFIIGAYKMGRLSEGKDVRNVALVFSIVSGVTFSLCAFMNDLWVLELLDHNMRVFHNLILLLYFLYGVIYSLGFIIAVKSVMTWIDIENRGLISCLWGASGNLGGVIYFNMFYHNVRLEYNWRYTFYYNGLLQVLSSLLIYRFLEPDPAAVGIHINGAEKAEVEETGQEEMSEMTQLYRMFRVRYAMTITMCYVMVGVQCTIIDFWLIVYLQDQGLHISAHKITSLYELFGMPGGLLLGYIVDKYMNRHKVTLFALIFLSTSLCFLIIQYIYKKMVYFLILSFIGSIMGGFLNYIMTNSSQLIIDDKEIQKINLKIDTAIGLLESLSGILILIFFAIIPQYFESIFLILSGVNICALLICLPEAIDELRRGPSQEAGEEEKLQLLGNHKND